MHICRQFKAKTEAPEKIKDDDDKWKLLVRKVVSAKALSCLSKRKREEELDKAPWLGKENWPHSKVKPPSVPCC